MSQSKRALHILDGLLQTLTRRSHTIANNNIPRLILFDVDGTLICSEKNGKTRPIVQATAKAFNCDIKRNNIPFSGKTDRGIIRDLLTANNVKYNESNVNKTISILPNIYKQCIELKEDNYHTLLNVEEILINLNKKENIVCGLLTGNIIDNVPIKLNAANPNLLQYFATINDQNNNKIFVGAFGSDQENRNLLLPYAKKRYAKYLNVDINNITNNDIIIIGDTPRDIECAHFNNVPAIGIATGRFNIQQLQDAGTDATLINFSDIDKATHWKLTNPCT